MKLMELNTNKPECVVVAEEPLITLDYIKDNKEKHLDIFASDLRNSNVGDVFQFNCDNEQPDYEEKLVIVFKNADGCVGVLKRFDRPNNQSNEKYYDEIFWFQLHSENQEPTDSMCTEEKVGYSILHGEVKINELCFAERTGNRAYYIYSFRYCRDCKNEEEYQQTLELLHSDINRLPNGRLREALEYVYDSYYDYKHYLKCKMM